MKTNLNMDGYNVIIGRQQETALLQEIVTSPKAELVVIYGHSRIGKAFLVSKVFRGKFVKRFNI